MEGSICSDVGTGSGCVRSINGGLGLVGLVKRAAALRNFNSRLVVVVVVSSTSWVAIKRVFKPQVIELMRLCLSVCAGNAEFRSNETIGS